MLAWIQPPALAAGLPDPPTEMPSSILLYLELVVNTESSGQVVPVQLRDGHFMVSAETLRELHVQTDAPGTSLVAVDQIPGVKVEYDSLAQRLLLSLPPEWLPQQEVGLGPRRFVGPTHTGYGLLLNYDAYGSSLDKPEAALSLWTEQRYFNEQGVFSNTGVYSTGLQGGKGEYRRYDTHWIYADPEKVRVLTVGDLVTSTLSWGNAARIGGIQLARNFAIRPDIVPYPLPQFSGSANVPSAVDLFINGYRASRENVQAGPFTLNSAPFINGAGEAAVVTTDALGRQVLTTVPFYVASNLLKPGTTDYAVSAGALRQNYGSDNFNYGQWASSASVRMGYTDTTTFEGRAEFSDGLSLGGTGVVMALGQAGVVNLAVSNSLYNSAFGQQWNYGYQYNAPRFGVGVQQTLQDANYTDLGLLGTVRSSTALGISRSTQFNLSGSIADWGAMSFAWIDVQAHDGTLTQIASANLSRSLGANNFLSVFLTQSPTSGERTLQLQWTMVFDRQGSLTATRTSNNASQGNQLQYSRSPEAEGGLGWNMAYVNGSGRTDYSQASVVWRASQVQVQGGMYGQGAQTSTWAGASGSLVFMDDHWFAANRINDAFALVSTDGVPDVPVRFENQLVGKTNENGHLLVTGVNSYYPSRFEIDTLDLPEYLHAPRTEQRIVLASGGGTLLHFDIEEILAANLTLVDERGQPLPVGLQVEHLGSGTRTVVGWEGQVYLEGLQLDNEIRISGLNFPACRVRFSIQALGPSVQRVGPLVCRPQAGFA